MCNSARRSPLRRRKGSARRGHRETFTRKRHADVELGTPTFGRRRNPFSGAGSEGPSAGLETPAQSLQLPGRIVVASPMKREAFRKAWRSLRKRGAFVGWIPARCPTTKDRHGAARLAIRFQQSPEGSGSSPALDGRESLSPPPAAASVWLAPGPCRRRSPLRTHPRACAWPACRRDSRLSETRSRPDWGRAGRQRLS